jgi:hypothetical protein
MQKGGDIHDELTRESLAHLFFLWAKSDKIMKFSYLLLLLLVGNGNESIGPWLVL